MTFPTIGVARRNAEGEQVCGDADLVIQTDISTLALVADGLGHGTEAALAAQRFCGYVREHPSDDLEALLRGAHSELIGTRGVAAGVIHIDHASNTLRFAGVGNVDVTAISSASIAPVCSPGVLGGRIKRIGVFTYPIYPGDFLVMYSDGVSRPKDLAPYRLREVQRAAEQILGSHAVGRDDATCMVVRI